LGEVKENLLNYKETGLGVMEMSHRGDIYETIMQEAESTLRELLNISNDYAVIFTPGGATMQFSMVPMNITEDNQTADYIVTGVWAEKAYEEASRLCSAKIAATSKDKNFYYIPEDIIISDKSAYLHYTSNNTIIGTQFRQEPETGGIPLVCDASSDLLHKFIDVTKYGLIYAGAQKNLGPAGRDTCDY
jgi:phosphoserine aminotransferase